MHLNKKLTERREIGKEAIGCISSDSNSNPNPNPLPLPLHHRQAPKSHTLDQFRFQPAIDAIAELTGRGDRPQAKNHHLSIEITESPAQNLISAPHKRPVVAQSSASSGLATSVDHFRHRNSRASLSSSSSYGFSSLPSVRFSIPSSTKQFLRKLLRHILRARLICFHLRFLLLLSVPPLYLFFLLINFRFFLLFVLAIIIFSFAIVVCLNFALPSLPSIRLFLARSLPPKRKFFGPSFSKSAKKEVVWSIGSKPVSEKRTTSGSWVQNYSNGDKYEGEFHLGKCSGSGVFYYSLKGRYEGEWIDGKYDGYGVETWAKGSRYRGQYRQGMRHGIGIYRFYTGDVYAGEWYNGQCHGCGVYTSEDGSKYVGEFKWGVKHGLGHYYFRNGDTYAGEYFADKMHGFGVYQFGNGHRYEGAWHEGRRQGLGIYTFRSGETQAGHWENGVLNIRSDQSSNTGSSFSVSHSKVLDAVQQARKAAKNAREVANVDERVNRAVMAANRAANAGRVASIKAVQKQMHDQ